MTSTTVGASGSRTRLRQPAPAPAPGPDPAAVLAAVAEPMRWRLLQLLAGRQLCTTHLQEMLDARQTLVSHHLRVLRQAGVVQTEPCGRFTYYRLTPGALDGLGAAVASLADAARGPVAKRPC